MGPMSKDFCWKSNPFGRYIPVCLNMWVPPPPPGIQQHYSRWYDQIGFGKNEYRKGYQTQSTMHNDSRELRGRTFFGDIWIFAKFLIGLHGVLQILLFKIWTAHILCIEIWILNPSGFTVEPHSKYWYFCIQVETYFHYASQKTPCYFTLNGCAENRGKCESATVSLHRGDSLSLTCVVWEFPKLTLTAIHGDV